jgi:hypothetical protein
MGSAVAFSRLRVLWLLLYSRMMLLLWPSPYVRWPLFPRHCCGCLVNKILPFFPASTVATGVVALLLLPRQCRCCLVNTKLPFAIVDWWLPSPQLLFYCHVCFNCGCWCCCLTAVALPMLWLLRPLLWAGWCGCLAKAAVVVRTLLLILPSEPYIMPFFLFKLWWLLLLFWR